MIEVVQRERETFVFLFLVESNDENDHGISEKNDLRISQPKYSQLLKELDFSHARMVKSIVSFSFLLKNE